MLIPSLTLSAPEHWWARGLTSPPSGLPWELVQLWPTPQGPMASFLGRAQQVPLRALLQEAAEWRPCPSPEGGVAAADLCHHRILRDRCDRCRYERTARLVVLYLGLHQQGLFIFQLRQLVGESQGKLAVSLAHLQEQRRIHIQRGRIRLTSLGRIVLEAYRRDAQQGQLGP